MPVIEVKLGDPNRLPTDETWKFIDSGLGPRPRTTSEMFLTWLVKMVDPKVAVEVGLLYGETTACLLDALRPGATLYALDIDTSLCRPVLDAWVELRLDSGKNLVFVEGRSQETIKSLPDGIGFAFIDGDHGAEAVLGDIGAIWPKMAPNGILAFHDPNDPNLGVAEALSRAFPEGPGDSPDRKSDYSAIYLPWHQGLVLVQKGPKAFMMRQVDRGESRIGPKDGLPVAWDDARAPEGARVTTHPCP